MFVFVLVTEDSCDAKCESLVFEESGQCFDVNVCFCAYRGPGDLAHVDLPSGSPRSHRGLRTPDVPTAFRHQHGHVSLILSFNSGNFGNEFQQGQLNECFLI